MIKILTSSIYHKISGGNIYNAKLYDFLKENSSIVKFEIIEKLNEYIFEKDKKYIIDGILVQEDLDINLLKGYQIVFLIHYWASLNLNYSSLRKTNLLKMEADICENFEVIVTGKPSLNYIEEYLRPSKKNYYLIEPAIDSKWRKKINFPEQPKKIIYLSNFIEGKGHLKLIEVALRLRDLDFSIDCYGEILSTSYFTEFQAKISELNLTNLTYKGKRSHAEINKLLLGYDLLLHFSDYEAFGMSTLEAISANLPFLITPTGHHEAYKRAGVLGILETFETDEITNCLSKLITSKETYKQHIESLSNFTPSTWESNFQPILNKLFQI